MSKKNLSRRHLLSIAGGAAGLLASTHALASEGDHAQTVNPDGKRRGGKGGADKVPVTSSEPQADTRIEPQPGAEEVATVRNERPPGPVFREISMPKASPEALAILGGLVTGSRVGAWTIAEIYDFHLGAVPVVLQSSDGSKFQVDVLRRTTGITGVAQTRYLSFFLSNRGSGVTRSTEQQGLGAMSLAAAVTARQPTASSTGLLTLLERVSRFPGAGYSVPI